MTGYQYQVQIQVFHNSILVVIVMLNCYKTQERIKHFNANVSIKKSFKTLTTIYLIFSDFMIEITVDEKVAFQEDVKHF